MLEMSPYSALNPRCVVSIPHLTWVLQGDLRNPFLSVISFDFAFSPPELE